MPLTEGELHADVKVHEPRFVDENGCEISHGYSGKLSMGVGGINSCVISRPWTEEELAPLARRKAARAHPRIRNPFQLRSF